MMLERIIYNLRRRSVRRRSSGIRKGIAQERTEEKASHCGLPSGLEAGIWGSLWRMFVVLLRESLCGKGSINASEPSTAGSCMSRCGRRGSRYSSESPASASPSLFEELVWQFQMPSVEAMCGTVIIEAMCNIVTFLSIVTGFA